MTTRHLFEFPNPVNEVSARLVASGVVAMCALLLITGWHWLLIPLAYGFVARVLTGPTLSPLGAVVTHLITPRLDLRARPTAGPPKRFAQGIGATLSVAALLAYFVGRSSLVAGILVGAILMAASLEAFFGYCLGCKVFGLLMRYGILSESVCESCNDITRRTIDV